MARAGDRIDNPLTGDKVLFIQTASDTNGEYLRFEEWLEVGGYGPVEHIHPLQHERFQVVSGTMGILLEGNVHILHKGDCMTVPPGKRHRWWNAGAEELDHISEFRPALQFEKYMETFFALGRSGKTFKLGGLPYALQFMLLSDTYRETVYLTPLPIPVQKVLYAIVAPIARLMGYKVY